MNEKAVSLRPLLYAAVFMIVGVLVLVWLGRDQSKLIGQRLEDVDLQPLLNSSTPITGQPWSDRVVVLHFWGTWCGPCRIEYPEFDALQNRFRSDASVRFISVSCSGGPERDLEELRQETQDFLASINPKAEIYSDRTAYTRVQLARMMASQGLGYPTTLVIDRGGIIREAWVGAANMLAREKKIREIARSDGK